MLNLIDQGLVFAEDVALTATGSTDWKDVIGQAGNASMYGQALELALVFTTKVAAGGDGTESYEIELEMADDDSGTNAETVVTSGTLGYAALPAGSQVILPMPKLDSYRRWYRVTVTLNDGDGAATITYDARLDKVHNLPQNPQYSSQTGY